ncbi:AAA family ATPase [Novosphingobium sp. JCM 18896]|uniref:AAA family ATPase n=1 Tax=Novosphingobium sp. JCM 18896 TaxID=2989731 RepID=UPI002223001C|nr:DnaB-like helicase C-terminal domain-containing protein [Novosphingobium sp. JCM 18896]MCW1431382.1 toprim domain-containing protein [Novosphingobium sp. JCM 18896]
MIEPRHKEWLDQRGGLSSAAEEMGFSSTQRSGAWWLSIPYFLDGKIVNRKYRRTGEKQHSMDAGGKLCLWNADVLSERPRELIITEGEFDALAAMVCGFRNVVSVPNGTSATETGKNPLAGNAYAYLYETEEALKHVETIILATDGDKPGRTLAHDLTCILGIERCKFVTYPEGCKDLNEVLVQYGQSAVVDVISSAKPYPVRGLYSLSDFPDDHEVRSMDTGIADLDKYMRICLGTLTVFSGYSNMGKSTVINTILAHCIARSVPVCIASFETLPKPILRNSLARALIGCSWQQFPVHEAREAALEQIEKHVTVISNALDDEADITLEAYLDLIRVAVVRNGAKVIVLDPWNEIEHKRNRDETETDYIGRAIRALKRFAKRYDVSLWVVAHPSKPQKGHSGKPGLYDISGSANWANKADYGLIYHRPDKTVNEGTLTVVKVRMGLPGECGEISVSLNDKTCRIEGNGFAS